MRKVCLSKDSLLRRTIFRTFYFDGWQLWNRSELGKLKKSISHHIEARVQFDLDIVVSNIWRPLLPFCSVLILDRCDIFIGSFG